MLQSIWACCCSPFYRQTPRNPHSLLSLQQKGKFTQQNHWFLRSLICTPHLVTKFCSIMNSLFSLSQTRTHIHIHWEDHCLLPSNSDTVTSYSCTKVILTPGCTVIYLHLLVGKYFCFLTICYCGICEWSLTKIAEQEVAAKLLLGCYNSPKLIVFSL